MVGVVTFASLCSSYSLSTTVLVAFRLVAALSSRRLAFRRARCRQSLDSPDFLVVVYILFSSSTVLLSRDSPRGSALCSLSSASDSILFVLYVELAAYDAQG